MSYDQSCNHPKTIAAYDCIFRSKKALATKSCPYQIANNRMITNRTIRCDWGSSGNVILTTPKWHQDTVWRDNRVTFGGLHYNDAIMSTMASEITSLSFVCLDVCSGGDQRKHQSSASLAFVRGIHRWPVDYPHTRPSYAEFFSVWWRHHDLQTYKLKGYGISDYSHHIHCFLCLWIPMLKTQYSFSSTTCLFYRKMFFILLCNRRLCQNLSNQQMRASCKTAVTPLLTHWSYCSLN